MSCQTQELKELKDVELKNKDQYLINKELVHRILVLEEKVDNFEKILCPSKPHYASEIDHIDADISDYDV